MSDLHDYTFLFLLSLLLATLKFTQFIGWSWWAVMAPTIIAFLLHIYVIITAEK